MAGSIRDSKKEAMQGSRAADYFARQSLVPGWGAEGRERLAAASVLVVGAGGLGCPVLAYLGRSGLGHLTIVDFDRVDASNLSRQTLFRPSDIGKPKVEAASAQLRDSNPLLEVESIAERLDAANVDSLVSRHDLIIDASDNFETKFLLHDSAFAHRKPFVSAALYQWEAQVLAFSFHTHREGCWRCLYPVSPEDGCVGTCEDHGVVGALCGVAGSFQALAALRLLLGLEGPVHCAAWTIDAAEWSPRILRWKADPACPICGHKDPAPNLKQNLHLGSERRASMLSPANGGPVLMEKFWDEISAEERRVVVDIREPWEIKDGEWDFFRNAGSEVVSRPWTQWATGTPVWEADTSYLIVCAHGVRSRKALAICAREAASSQSFISLRGGVAGLLGE